MSEYDGWTAQVREAIVAVAGQRPGIGADEARVLVGEQVGFPGDDLDHERTGAAEHVLDGLIMAGTLQMLAPDRLVVPAQMARGIVLTHRVDRLDKAAHRLPAGDDLAGLAVGDRPFRLAGGEELDVERGSFLHRWWFGPEGWLDDYDEGTLLAFRVDDAGVVTIEVVEQEPAVDAGLVAALRAVYDHEVAEPDLPIAVADLLWGLLLEDPTRFRTTAPPLVELCAAAGLEVSGGLAVHEPRLWDNQRSLMRLHETYDSVDDEDEREAVLDMLAVLDGEMVGTDAVVASAEAMRDPEWLSSTAAIAFGRNGDLEGTARALHDLLTRDWSGPVEAVLRWFAAVAAERAEDPRTAMAHLEAAVKADPAFLPVVDRLAWCRGDTGDAAGAARLWARIADAGGDVDADLAVVQRYAARSAGSAASPAGSAGAGLGRNDRCWCGSGRKFKACHLGRPGMLPLAERVPWLWRKAEAYVERRGGSIGDDLYDMAEARCGGEGASETRIADAMDDPLVVDAVLTECEWLGLFSVERGGLVPDDEAALVREWTKVERRVFDVVGVLPGDRVVLDDLATGNEVEIVDHTFARTARPGMVVCGRVLPDGEGGRRLLGGAFHVPGGAVDDLLGILEVGDGYELLLFVAELGARRGPWDGEVDDDDEFDDGERDGIPVTDSPQLRAALEQIRDRFERQWCDEPVPALGGRTPRDAVADPEGRAEVVALLATFPEDGDETIVGGRLGAAMRPSRLRELLGLDLA